jgi:glycosyltransferase involved in cell wall biosynthesis
MADKDRLHVITTVYPVRYFPQSGSFVANFVNRLSRHFSATRVFRISSIWQMLYDYTVFRSWTPVKEKSIPTNHISLPRGNHPAWLRFNFKSAARALKKRLKREPESTVVYCHFYRSLYVYLRSGHYNGAKQRLFVCLGESDFDFFSRFTSKEGIGQDLSHCTGIICVSKPLFDLMVSRYPSLENKIHLIPNGVDLDVFRPLDKAWCRERLKLPPGDRIVVFIGHFNERKGVLRVARALDHLDCKPLRACFLGSGEQTPVTRCEQHCLRVPNHELPVWLGAADVFVLPSLAEGMPNAVLEAAACGLPLVISDRPFNRAFLNDDEALWVDPTSVDSIADGLRVALDNADLRDQLRRKSLEVAQRYSIDKRVTRNLELFQASPENATVKI